jgi:CDP-diacylglycerol--glycerol-3-phosphate 3-phosphatidyltransferase
VIDRVTDAFLLGGVAWFLISDNPNHPHVGMVPVAVLAMSSIISYQRAKAESLGLHAKGGLMERATAVQRFVKVWKQAAVAPITAARIELRRSRRQSRRVVRANRRAQVLIKRARQRPTR